MMSRLHRRTQPKAYPPIAMTVEERVWARLTAVRIVRRGFDASEGRRLLDRFLRESRALWCYARMAFSGHRCQAMEAATRLTGLSPSDISELLMARSECSPTPAQVDLQAAVMFCRDLSDRRLRYAGKNANPRPGRAAEPISTSNVWFRPRQNRS